MKGRRRKKGVTYLMRPIDVIDLGHADMEEGAFIHVWVTPTGRKKHMRPSLSLSLCLSLFLSLSATYTHTVSFSTSLCRRET